MKSSTSIRYSKTTKQDVVNAIVMGELWLEEAMVKYGVSDRKKIITWLRKYRREKMKQVC